VAVGLLGEIAMVSGVIELQTNWASVQICDAVAALVEGAAVSGVGHQATHEWALRMTGFGS